MKTAHWAPLGCLLLVGWLCSCQSSQNAAREVLADELAARREGQAKSMQLYRRGLEAQEASRAQEARTCFAAAVEADGDNVYAWMSLGACDFERGDYYRAAEAFHVASRLAPNRFEPHLNAGTVYEVVGRYVEAIKSYEAALRLEPRQLETMENLARACIRANQDLPRARELIEQALLREQRSDWRQWLTLQSLRLSSGQQPAMAETAQPDLSQVTNAAKEHTP